MNEKVPNSVVLSYFHFLPSSNKTYTLLNRGEIVSVNASTLSLNYKAFSDYVLVRNKKASKEKEACRIRKIAKVLVAG